MSKKPWICALCRSIVSTRLVPRRAQHVGHEFRRNRDARLVLAILPCVAVIRQHRRDARGRRPAERVDHDRQLDQVIVDAAGDAPVRVAHGAGRLHDEHVGAADVLVDLKRDLRIRKPPQPRLPDRHAEKLRDLARQFRMGAAREDFQLAEPGRHERIQCCPTPTRMAGAEGFEPSNTGSKVPRLTAWPRPNSRQSPVASQQSLVRGSHPTAPPPVLPALIRRTNDC